MAFCTQFHNKNQFLINSNGNITFQSYNSTIAIFSRDNCGTLTFGKDWDFSKTTLKHLYLFIKEFVQDFCENLYIKDDYKFLADHIDFQAFEDSKNKRAFLQNLIDNNIIKYNEEL